MPAKSRTARGADAAGALARLGAIAREHGGEPDRKRELLSILEHARLPTAAAVLKLHELCCYLVAYPDDEQVLELARRVLATFAERQDLRAHSEELASSGIAGTPIYCEFGWFTFEWLTRRWPRELSIDWESFASQDALDAILYPVLQEHERLAYEGTTRSLEELLDDLRAPDETDAAYLAETFRRLRIEPMVLEHLFDSLGIGMRLEPGLGTPARSNAHVRVDCVRYLEEPPPEPTGTVRERVEAVPREIRSLSSRAGAELVHLGREAMITRGRDLFAFVHADARDAHVVDFGEGLQFTCVGLVPERRHLLYAQYVLMALHNGVPVGYVQACMLFDSAEINFNVFDTFRGVEASRIFVSSLALVRHLFGVDAFTINTQQLGQGNPEALATGAWWFYYKHGFRPRDPDIKRVVRGELEARQREPGHRSDLETLEELSSGELYFFLDGARTDNIGRVDPSKIGAGVARHTGERVHASGAQAATACAAEVAELLGVRSLESWSAAEREAWRRWAPLALALPGVARWSVAERRELAEVIRLKGSVCEADYLEAFRRHPKLTAAVLELAR